ncbi:MAG: hypothetical protein QOC66_2039 [Pseudonocardiales bacterium]|nr:hypothetical protein [Pseudonocardiales bacterium]
MPRDQHARFSMNVHAAGGAVNDDDGLWESW